MERNETHRSCEDGKEIEFSADKLWILYSPMLVELFQTTKFNLASVTHPDTGKVSQSSSDVLENDALVATVKQNIFERQTR